MVKKLNVDVSQPVGAAGDGVFEMTATGFDTQVDFLAVDPDGYHVQDDGIGYLLEDVIGTKDVVVRVQNSEGYAIGKRVSMAVPTGIKLRAPELMRSVAGFAVAVPLAYHRRVAGEAFDPAVHSVSDPLVPTCAIYTHKAVKSGNWSDPTVWDTGTIPHSAPDGTAVVCTNGYNITYDMLSDVKIKDLHINGASRFRFATTRTRLWVDTIMCDGKWIMGDKSAPIPDSGLIVGGKRVPQCEIVFWASEAPLATTRLGLNTMGPVRIRGAAKKHRLFAPATLAAGSSTITLENDPAAAGWKEGDEILIVATEAAGTSPTDSQYTGPIAFYGGNQGSNSVFTRTLGYKLSQDEVRTISSISGNTITLNAPLTYNHILYTDTLPRGQVVTLKPCIAMLTHSIRLRTADASDSAIWSGANLADRQKRAHTMFMFCDDVQARYAEAKNMGRTDVDPSLVPGASGIKYADSGSVTPITDENNVRGRYPWHMHRNGAYLGRKMVAFENLTAWAPTSEVPQPGWAITHHDARGAVDDCVVYNVRGAGIVSELGNEIGQWIGNVVAWCRGDGFSWDWGQRADSWTNHNGAQGTAFDNQARQMLIQGSTVSSAHAGATYLQQFTDIASRLVDGASMRYRDPLTQGFGTFDTATVPEINDAYGALQPQAPEFNDNTFYACGTAFWKAHQQSIDRYDKTPFIIRRMHTVNCGLSYKIVNYTPNYYVYDSLWIGQSQASSTGAWLGTVTWELSFVNVKVRRMNMGFLDAGHLIGYHSYWIDCDKAADVNTFGSTVSVNLGSDPNVHPLKDLMGTWEVTGATTAIVRRYESIPNTALPVNTPLAPFGPAQTVRDANPCPAYGEDPYFVLDPTSVLTVGTGGLGSVSIKGVIVDSVGYRRYASFSSPESNLGNMAAVYSRPLSHPTGMDLVKRNGCFLDGATWKSRMWHIDVDRATGKMWSFYIDMPLSGFATSFLQQHTVDPNRSKPVLPIVPERTADTVLEDDTTPPSILVKDMYNVAPGVTYSLLLDADDGQVRWSIAGGADAAQFELNNNRFLRWASNGTRSKTAPADANGDNVYEVVLRATDRSGNYSEKAVAFNVSYFRDDFDGADNEYLANREGWTLFSGTANRILLKDGHVRRARQPTTGTHCFKANACTGPNQSVRFKKVNGSYSEARLRYTDNNNYVAVRADLGIDTVGVWECVGGVRTEIARYSKPTYSTTTIRADLIGSNVTVYYNDVARTPTAGTGVLSGTLPNSNDVGLKVEHISFTDYLFDWIEFETLP